MDAPAIVLVGFTLAALLFLVEAALPTFGVAGLAALALTALAVISADSQQDPWWPLMLVALAVFLWAVLLTLRRRSQGLELTAIALFAVGGGTYGLLAGDLLTVGLSVVAAAGLPFAFHPLMRATNRLLAAAPQLGMDALVGRTGTVVSWEGDAGTVRVDGSLWNATSPSELWPGAVTTVIHYTGMTLEIALVASVL